MVPKDASARARMLASLSSDRGRTLARARERAWTAGDILGAAAALRPTLLAGQGPVGIAFAQPGWVLAALLAAWSARRLPLLFDPGLRREAEVLQRIHPGIASYADAGPSRDGRIVLDQVLAASTAATAVPDWLALPADDEPFASLLTSASTGEHKAIGKRGHQFYRQAEALAAVLELPPGGRVLSFVPPFHLLGFFYGLILPLVQAAETVVAAELAGAAMVESLAKYRPNLVVGTPTHYRFLARATARAEVSRPDTVFLSSGAPLDPSVAEAFAARFGTSVLDFYGSTELGGVAFRAWPEPYRAMPGVRWRIDAATAALEVMSPWGGGPEGAWLCTDDAAEPVGGEGFRLLGRLDHVVKVGGKRFSTVEVEQALRTMPGVAEAAVLPYQRFGEPAVAAVIVPEPGVVLDDVAVRAFLAERLATYKLPRSLLFRAALPKGSHDKIDYQALRALLASEPPA
jgi:acyl-coenzyme A synthetase/AMP-(fatty) acid ligase